MCLGCVQVMGVQNGDSADKPLQIRRTRHLDFSIDPQSPGFQLLVYILQSEYMLVARQYGCWWVCVAYVVTAQTWLLIHTQATPSARTSLHPLSFAAAADMNMLDSSYTHCRLSLRITRMGLTPTCPSATQ